MSNPTRQLSRETSAITHSGMANASLFNPSNTQAPNLNVFQDLILKDLDKLNPNMTLNWVWNLCVTGRTQLCARRTKGVPLSFQTRHPTLQKWQEFCPTLKPTPVLSMDHTIQFKRELKSLITKGFDRGILNQKEKDLVSLAPRLPVMYILPKLHKTLVNPPKRPIISGIDSITSQVGKYIDHYFQLLVMGTPFLKDTKHVINILNTNERKPTYLLVTADVASLYKAISQKLGYESVQCFLSRDTAVPSAQSNFILKLLEFSMSHNYFFHNGSYYLQTKGVDKICSQYGKPFHVKVGRGHCFM